ncbi:FkbM family methyltransferase [Nocardiopsis sp. YSL2]|uniref:FkbM family methyltransferase n=1 Tax=Nocardiopsis sp. YSL2 TaxID=2939492 RepID=UPI0026F4311F|nr:FkbM family methyltransferase [Nocardiopsis sp. YSL2]
MGSVFRSFPELVSRLGLDVRHLVHVGAHQGEEMPYYRMAGVGHVTLVEPIPRLVAALRRTHPDATVIEAACASTPGRARLHIPRRTNMATLATPQTTDGRTRAVDVEVTTLAHIQAAAEVAPDAAVIDAQGRELDVLDGADLASLDLVVVETCTVADPTMASPHRAVVERMAAAGFTEADRWVRDYAFVARWARGPGQPAPGPGEVRDVVFTREEQR